MADYKELLRRAIKALPENNGAARRGVYEKARSALVGQLRAINPPLPAKDITQHRLQLEDCIRQVEQEASEAVISLKHHEEPKPAPAFTPPPAPAPAEAKPEQADAAPEPVEAKPQDTVSVQAEPVAAKPEPVVIKPVEYQPKPVSFASGSVKAPEPVKVPEPAPKTDAPEAGSIEDIIAQAEQATAKPVEEPKLEPVKFETRPEEKPAVEPVPIKTGPRPLPSIVARAEAAKAGPTSPIGSAGTGPRPIDSGRRPLFEPRRDASQQVSAHHHPVAAPRLEPSMRGQQAAALQQIAEPLAALDQTSVSPAMSAVREVDVEPEISTAPTADAENAIERAIATLDREARGDSAPLPPNTTRLEFPGAIPEKGPTSPLMRSDDEEASPRESAFNRAPVDRERGGGSAMTIFLLLFVVLLAGAGGGGYWAWREGYIDLDQMFGRTAQAVVSGTAIPETGGTTETAMLTPEAAPTAAEAIDTVTGPGNTAPLGVAEDPAVELTPDERLVPETEVAAGTPTPALSGDPVGSTTLTPSAEVPTEALALVPTDPATDAVTTTTTDERLPSGDVASTDAQLPEGTAATADPSTIAGSQSLLLEASDDGTTGAVPFSGTVDWSKGVDELGQPTLVGKASIPARNLGVELLIRKNSDPSLPASHLMEINFDVSDTFIGGSVAQLPGVLLKNEELVQGTPLVGASARVVGNSFLFALSASAQDNAANNTLMTTRKWMDLAIIYATGKRAIITLEKDDTAEALFTEVFAAWNAPTDTASTTQ